MTIRRFRLAAFLAFLLLIVAAAAVSLATLQAQESDALVINLAGRQRMLIQRLVLEALGVQNDASPAYRQALVETAHTHFEPTLEALVSGGEVRSVDGISVRLPPTRDPEILAQLRTVRATWREMDQAIRVVLEEEPQSPALDAAVSRIERLAPVLVTQMDLVVRLYEGAAARRVARAHAVQMSSMVVGLVLLIVVLSLTHRWILAPISRLEAAARRIGQGDLTTPVVTTALGEIGRLANSFDEMRSRLAAAAEAQAILLELSRSLLAAKDERTIAESAVAAAAAAVRGDCSTLVLSDAQGQLVVQATYGWVPHLVGNKLGRGENSQTGYTILHGDPVVVEDYARETAFAVPAVVLEQGLVSGVSVPMIHEERVTGAMLVYSRRRRRFGADDIQQLSLIANQTAVALDKTHLLGAERQRADELEVLSATVADILGEHDLSRLLHATLRRAVTLLGASGGDLGIYDAAREEVLIVGSHNMGKDSSGTRMALGEGITGRVAQSCEPLIVEDYTGWEANPAQYDTACWHAAMGAPMMAGGRLVGVIGVVDSDPERKFGPSDLRLLSLFAQQAALTIERANLFEAAQRRAQEAETLRQAGSVVVATLRQDEAIERILQQLARVVPYDSASVQLLREGSLEIVGGHGWSDMAGVIGMRFPIPGDNPNTVVIQERRPHILANAPAAHALFRDNPHNHIQSWLGVPLVVRDRVIGMLAVDSRQADYFTPDHVRLVAAFADQVAIAIENARLFEIEQRGRGEVAALLGIMQMAGSSLELKQVLKHIAQQTARVCRANRCSIFLLDDSGEYLRPVMSQYADGRAELEEWRRFKAVAAGEVEAVPLFRRAIREQLPTLLDNVSNTDQLPLDWTQPFGIQKLLAIPLVSYGRAIGLLALDHTDASREFTLEEIDLALTIGGQVTSAITNARLYAEAEMRAEELAMLAHVGEALNRAQTADETLQLVLAEAVRLGDRQQGSVILVDPETGALQLIAEIGLAAEEVREFNARRLRADEGVFALCIGRGEMVEIADATADPRVVYDYPRNIAAPLTKVPLKTARGAIGVIALSGLPRDDRARRLLRALADLASAAIEKANLLEETRRRAEQLRALHESSRALTSDLRLEVVLQTLADTARHLASARQAVLVVLDADGTVAQSYIAGFTAPERHLIGERSSRWAFLKTLLEQGVPIRIVDLERDVPSFHLPPLHRSVKTFMGVPIVARGRPLGALCLGNKVDGRSFTQEDENLMVSLAADAAAAIENAHLFGEVQRLAITDELTGLPNRRHFFELAEYEFERARRYGRELSAIMLDIDRFKEVNDTYGHVVGDQILVGVAGRCRENLRDADLLARYGGEEFVALLPESALDGAGEVAQRLCRSVAAAPYESDEGPLSITISLGIAAVTKSCPNLTTLLKRADVALYDAKKAGRNRVRAWREDES